MDYVEFALTVAQVDAAADKRLKQMAKTVKVAGFRPGHVPMARVKQMYGQQANWEALNDQVGEKFAQIAQEQNLYVVGTPSIEPVEGKDTDSELNFVAKFEVYPEIPAVDLSGAEIEQANCTVTDADVTRTIDVLRQQRVQYEAADKAAEKEDQVNINFVGKIDDVAFEGGSAENYPFVLGQGRMLPEFETAAFALKKKGDLSGVVETKFGFHVLQLEEKRPAGIRPFEDVRDELIKEVKSSVVQEARVAEAQKLQQGAKINAPAVSAFAAEYSNTPSQK